MRVTRNHRLLWRGCDGLGDRQPFVGSDRTSQVRNGLAAGGRWIRTSGSPTDPLPFSRKQSRLPWRFDGLATRNRKFEPCYALVDRLALALISALACGCALA